MKRIIQIIPYRRLIQEGVGDYGSMIATEWKRQNGTETVFLATTPKDFDGECSDGHETHYLESHKADTLVETLASLTSGPLDAQIILHMSAYGYHRYAVPLWLLKGMTEFRAQHPKVSLLTVFHEIYATSTRPWTSSFYMTAFQKYVAKKILLLSDQVVTPCETYAKELTGFGLRSGVKVKPLPVFSTVGTALNNAQEQGGVRLALFGGRPQRHQIFTAHLEALTKLCAARGVSQIVDMGSRDERFPKTVNGIPVRQTGRLSAEQVSDELSQCQYGVITYDAARLGKSTVMACFAAHGLNIMCFDKAGQASEGLISGTHLIIAGGDLTHSQLEALPHTHKAMADWYAPHGLEAQIPIFEALLAQET